MTDSTVKAVLFYSETPRKYDSSLYEISAKKILKSAGTAKVYSSIPDLCENTVSGSVFDCLEKAAESCKNDRDTVLLFRGISPLFDGELFSEMMKKHDRYLSHYTCSENVPPGILPDAVSLEFLRAVPREKKAGVRSFAGLRDFVIKNIDEYDLEIFYREPDLRQYRLDFTCETDRSEFTAGEILKLNPDPSYFSLKDLILKNPAVLRPAPSYLEISLTDESPVDPVFLPQTEEKASLPDGSLNQILSEAASHPFKNDLTVSLAGTGEPLLYKNIAGVVENFTNLDTVKILYLETYGASFSEDLILRMKKIKHPEKIHVIFRITTLDPLRYKKLYGADLLKQVLANAELVKQAAPEFTVYAEMIKMKDVGDEVENYFNYFTSKNISVILSKFNRYADLLEERRVSDLTPFHRDFCWHLTRDIFVTSAGKIPLCRQDLFAKNNPSFLEKDGLYASFHKNLPSFEKSLISKHDEISMPCLKCDEWYTFMG